MKIYFGASITNDRSMLPVYTKIVKTLKDLKYSVPSEHVVDPKLTEGNWQAAYQPRKLFEREVNRLKECDAMVAEVTTPSWGTAFLIEQALELGKPVLALFYKETGQPLPMMIAGHPELYVEHYEEANIQSVIKKNLKHFEQMQQTKGKLIVIDGADGSGKATQSQMLQDYFKSKRTPTQTISFPRYYTSFHGKHVGRFLTGEFGGNGEVSPYLSSLAFALDRLTARDEIVEWLKEGQIVIADRYVSASMAHQASKLPKTKRKEFIDWLYSMEYKEHKLPKEDIVLYLYVPVETAQKLIEKKSERKYVKGKDAAERDITHQKRSIKMYQELSKKYRHWQMVSCVDDSGKLLSKEQVHSKIVSLLTKKKIIKK